MRSPERGSALQCGKRNLVTGQGRPQLARFVDLVSRADLAHLRSKRRRCATGWVEGQGAPRIAHLPAIALSANKGSLARGLFTLKHECERLIAGCSARRRERRWCRPISERQQRNAPASGLSLRVGLKCGVCFGEQLANGTTIRQRRSSRSHPHCDPTHLMF